jgi:hypothetical protein
VFELERKKESKKERICRRTPEKTKDDFEEFSLFKKKFLRKNQFWKERRSKIGCLRRLRLCRAFPKNLVLEGRKH